MFCASNIADDVHRIFCLLPPTFCVANIHGEEIAIKCNPLCCVIAMFGASNIAVLFEKKGKLSQFLSYISTSELLIHFCKCFGFGLDIIDLNVHSLFCRPAFLQMFIAAAANVQFTLPCNVHIAA